MNAKQSARFSPRLLRSLILPGFAILCHGLGVLLFLELRNSLSFPGSWDIEFFSLVAISLALTLFAIGFRRQNKAKIALVLIILCFIMISFPLPLTSGVQLALAMPLLLESAAVFSRPASVIFCAVLLLLVLFFERTDFAWGHAVAKATMGQELLFTALLATECGLSLALWKLDESRERAVSEIGRLNRAIDRLSEVNASFQEALASADKDFSLRERNRITREIHDITGYALTNQQMMLEAALLLTDDDDVRLRELLTMARATVAEGLQDSRRVLYELRKGDAEQEDLGFGVLLKVVRNFESVTGIRVNVDFTNARSRLSRESWLMVYRLVQESMINAFRHGNAKSIAITFREDETDFFVNVRDDGRGMVSQAEGIGLKGMRERAEALGGNFSTTSSIDGFLVSASLPKIREESDNVLD